MIISLLSAAHINFLQWNFSPLIFILTFDVRIIAMNIALRNVSVYCTASLLVELFGEPAMDKYILVIPALQHCVLVEHLKIN